MRTRITSMKRSLVASTRISGNGEISRANKNFKARVQVTEVTSRQQRLDLRAKMLGL